MDVLPRFNYLPSRQHCVRFFVLSNQTLVNLSLVAPVDLQ